jgi:hypothetical protein
VFTEHFVDFVVVKLLVSDPWYLKLIGKTRYRAPGKLFGECVFQVTSWPWFSIFQLKSFIKEEGGRVLDKKVLFCNKPRSKSPFVNCQSH